MSEDAPRSRSPPGTFDVDSFVSLMLTTRLLAVVAVVVPCDAMHAVPTAVRPSLSVVSRRPEPVMVGTLGKVAALPALYALMSVNEYATHRWYQHEEFNRGTR